MKHLYLLLFSYMVISCTEMRTVTTLDDCDVVATKKNENLIVCELDAVKQTITLPFSELFKEWELVKLENTSIEIMVGPDQRIFISDNYVWKKVKFATPISGKLERQLNCRQKTSY